VPSTPVSTTSQPEKTHVEHVANATPVQTSPESHTVPDLTPQQLAEDTFSKLKVQAIMYHGVDSSVLINGRSLRLGDSIEGARIFSVEPLAVTLDKEGFQHKYRLK